MKPTTLTLGTQQPTLAARVAAIAARVTRVVIAVAAVAALPLLLASGQEESIPRALAALAILAIVAARLGAFRDLVTTD